MLSVRQFLLVFPTLLCLAPINGACLDQSPMWSFEYKGRTLTYPYVKSVTPKGVEVSGRINDKETTTVIVPLEDAEKMPSLLIKAEDEIAEAKAQPMKELQAQMELEKENESNYSRVRAFDATERIPQGWIVYICELGKNIDLNSPSKMEKDSWGSGSKQRALLLHYGKPTAEGDRIITQVEEAGIQDVDFDGRLRPLRVFEVIGQDRSNTTSDNAKSLP